MADADRTSNTMIVRLTPGADPSVLGDLGLSAWRRLPIVDDLYRAYLHRLDDEQFVRVLEAANAHVDVAYAEPDYRGIAALVPDDPGDGAGVGSSWWLDEINAFDAWDVATSATAIGPIMLFDTRPSTSHPDLSTNLWTNALEIAGNGVDDDGNGHVDDVHGVNLDGIARSHGTGAAGTICAQGDNNIGYVGTAWDCELLFYATAGTFSEYADALSYAIANGSRVSNHSWGTLSASQSLADAVDAAEANGHLMIVAAHNFARDLDTEPIYPASLTNDNIITVAASGPSGSPRDYTDWGAASVDIAAPADFATTKPSGYGDFGGTSQAAPVVTGAVALLWSQVPGWSASQVRAHVLATSRQVASWQGLSTSGGVLDLGAMLTSIASPDDGQSGTPTVTPTPSSTVTPTASPTGPTPTTSPISPPTTPVSTSTPDQGLPTSGDDDSVANEAFGGIAADGILHVVSCLGPDGRVDTTVVNTGSTMATFQIEFGQLTPRERTLAPGDWWRMPVTGRPDGNHTLRVTRDGSLLVDTAVTVACDVPTPRVTHPDVHVINTCRDGNGYILFQMTNPSASSRSWIIEFENVNNRSTTAAGAGSAVRAVSGRPDGDHEVRIRHNGQTVSSMTLTVDCD